MGTVEMALLLKYGIPLAVKLLANGKNEKETTELVSGAITDLGKDDIVQALVTADEAQTNAIVNALFGVITGASGALAGLLGVFWGLLKKK
jgi:hypothetical protein